MSSTNPRPGRCADTLFFIYIISPMWPQGVAGGVLSPGVARDSP
jgi:hypothetical protein